MEGTDLPLRVLERPRELQVHERLTLEFIFTCPFQGAADAERQLDRAKVAGEFDDGSIRFVVHPGMAPADVPYGVPAVWGLDEHGRATEVQLHIADGYLYALDFYNYDGVLAGRVDPLTLRCEPPPV